MRTEPEYTYTDSIKGFSKVFILAVAVFFLPIAVLVILIILTVNIFAIIGLAIYLFIFGNDFFFQTFFFAVAAPVIRLRAYKGVLIVDYGFLHFTLAGIHAHKIVKVSTLPGKIKNYPYQNPRRMKGWRFVYASVDSGCLAIETQDRKYLISCPNPDEAVRKLREIYNLSSADVDQPQIT